MSLSKESVEHTEYMDGGSPPPRRKGGRVKRHCAKFWWLHLIVFIVIFLIILLPVVYVGYPKIAQEDINKSQIITTAQIITNPAADHLDLGLEGFLETSSMFHPTLRGFNASLYLMNQNTSFANISVPELLGKNGTTFSTMQTLQITNLAGLTAYCVELLGSPSINITLIGRGALKLGGLPTTHVNYNQTIALTGLNALKGVAVTEFHLGGAGLPFGANSHGNATIPNPSVNKFDFGDVALNMFVDDVAIGNVTLPNLVMTPGNNSYPMYATANQTALLSVLAKPQYKCGVIPVTMHGNSSTKNGQLLPYFTTALSAAPIVVPLNLTNTLAEIGLSNLANGTCQS